MDSSANTGARPMVDGRAPSRFLLPRRAIIFAGGNESELAIVSVTVLDRLVVSLSRAGFDRILLVGSSMGKLSRATDLGISVEYAERLPPILGPVLVTSGNVLVTADDLRRMIGARGRLMGSHGEPLPVGIVEDLSENWQACLDRSPAVMAGGLATIVTAQSAKRVERGYWASLTSSSDGLVDRHFNRPVGRLLSKQLTKTRVSPNQVSIIATLAGLASAWLFGMGTAKSAVAGALVLQGSAILDCIDGDLARALYKQSPLGKWLDIVGDQVVHMAVFVGIGVGLWRAGSDAPVLLLGGVAALGVVLSFIVILRAMLNPALKGHGRLQKLIDATTNRDFSVLLILFALFDLLDCFLWVAAVGSHVFWLAAVTLQFHENRSTTRDGEGA